MVGGGARDVEVIPRSSCCRAVDASVSRSHPPWLLLPPPSGPSPSITRIYSPVTAAPNAAIPVLVSAAPFCAAVTLTPFRLFIRSPPSINQALKRRFGLVRRPASACQDPDPESEARTGPSR